MATAIASALSGIPVNHSVAMTGEITLRGRVLAIGGLREKTMAAYRSGIETVLFPAENLPDLAEVDEAVKKAVTFLPMEKVEQVLEAALVRTPHPAAHADAGAAPASQEEGGAQPVDPGVSVPAAPMPQ